MKSIPFLAATAAAATMAQADIPRAADRIAMIDTVTSIAAGADRHQWDRVRAAFADKVTLDYSSLWGGGAAVQSADDVVAQFAGFLPGFDATLHLVTNHTVTEFDGERATLEADFLALHKLGDAEWRLAGRYTYQLVHDVTWKVGVLTMTWTHEADDRTLVAKAAERTVGAD